MEIKAPCKLGEFVDFGEEKRKFSSLIWFQWSDGLEYTYFFDSKGKWTSCTFFCEKNVEYPTQYHIDDSLLINEFLKSKDFPIKGRGFVSGLRAIDDKLYVEIILTDKYLAHIYAECNESGQYIENGTILVPPSWDTREKQYSIIFNKYDNIQVKCY